MESGTIGGFILSILMLSVLIVGFTIYYGAIPSAYGTNSSNFTNDTYLNGSGAIYQQAIEMKSKTEDIQITPIAEINYLWATMNGAYAAIKLSYNAVDFFTAFVISGMAEAIGLPVGWVLGFVYAAVAVIVTLLVLGAIYKWELVRW